jgi:hypothetical protein
MAPGLFDWARTDGVTWVYIFKVLAAFITCGWPCAWNCRNRARR